jgi:hypothetical protein
MRIDVAGADSCPDKCTGAGLGWARGSIGGELRETAMRMTHLYWYTKGCPFADEESANRIVSLLYVDAN